MAWIIQNNELTNTDFVNVPDKPFHGDSPYTFWRIDPNANEGMPYVGLMIGVPVLSQAGAFKDAASLAKVTIPTSCTSIGAYAFSGTQLTEVTIPQGCTYEETSFPAGCKVNTYGGGYGQLYDGDGCAVIDGDGSRVYINP